MKRTWTIIGVGDVPGSFKWYQALFGQPAIVPLENPEGFENTGIILLVEFILRCPFPSSHSSLPFARRSVHGPISNSRIWPCVTKLTFFAAP
jgi:hypothetical protein